MEELLESISAVVTLIPTEKVEAIATCIRQTEASHAMTTLSSLVGTPVATTTVEQLVIAWQKNSIRADELSSMLLAASHVFNKTVSKQTTELVWTGPTTPFVSARRTEQVLLQLIDSARNSLFITSYVAYGVSSIVNALNSATARSVEIVMLLESSQDHGGSINIDVIGKMRNLVPDARLYAWHDQGDKFIDGRVHAKVAVADGKSCFITSANLTGYAMEKNMEAGVLISGGNIPQLLGEHLHALISTRVIVPV